MAPTSLAKLDELVSDGIVADGRLSARSRWIESATAVSAVWGATFAMVVSDAPHGRDGRGTSC